MGTVFDIKEFAIYDGPGVRTTVFLKGCPLRCRWCHNPEGLSMKPQLMVSAAACTDCGKCRAVCESPEKCTGCGKCIPYCPDGLRRMAGYEISPEELARRIKRSAVFEGGGVTFSGGEPMLQWDFVRETAQLLNGMHRAIETSGFCPAEDFAEMAGILELVMMDIKLADPVRHKIWTGADNGPIMRNLETLKNGKTPFIIRIPLIPGVNDDMENLEATARLISGSDSLLRVELLPYHETAGAKYPMAGMEYAPGFDTSARPEKNTEPFEKMGIECELMA